jgi:hypothetical protein
MPPEAYAFRALEFHCCVERSEGGHAAKVPHFVQGDKAGSARTRWRKRPV